MNRINWRSMSKLYPSYAREIYRKRKDQIALAVLFGRLNKKYSFKTALPLKVTDNGLGSKIRRLQQMFFVLVGRLLE